MLWDLIRDFFVQHVFGGLDSNGHFFEANFGSGWYESDGTDDMLTGVNIGYKVGLEFGSAHGESMFLTASDWLSTTATAISITIIVVLCCLFVYKIIKLIGGLIR